MIGGWTSSHPAVQLYICVIRGIGGCISSHPAVQQKICAISEIGGRTPPTQQSTNNPSHICVIGEIGGHLHPTRQAPTFAITVAPP